MSFVKFFLASTASPCDEGDMITRVFAGNIQGESTTPAGNILREALRRQAGSTAKGGDVFVLEMKKATCIQPRVPLRVTQSAARTIGRS
jgi:hypothetical protein